MIGCGAWITCGPNFSSSWASKSLTSRRHGASFLTPKPEMSNPLNGLFFQNLNFPAFGALHASAVHQDPLRNGLGG